MGLNGMVLMPAGEGVLNPGAGAFMRGDCACTVAGWEFCAGGGVFALGIGGLCGGVVAARVGSVVPGTPGCVAGVDCATALAVTADRIKVASRIFIT